MPYGRRFMDYAQHPISCRDEPLVFEPPQTFVEKVAKWKWLCTHFQSEKYQVDMELVRQKKEGECTYKKKRRA
ncbi:hypothetical protein C1H46_044543 [Malus baccata]|uniref:Uncharacterized protein n=1 Tax=Malus baccata TaxID=106549 RepID=A0A540K6T2_MALBA|nr:hypothetical protein C1H46_044543 [Malus baccata]